jgi:hypothetical protein
MGYSPYLFSAKSSVALSISSYIPKAYVFRCTLAKLSAWLSAAEIANLRYLRKSSDCL